MKKLYKFNRKSENYMEIHFLHRHRERAQRASEIFLIFSTLNSMKNFYKLNRKSENYKEIHFLHRHRERAEFL